MLERREILDNPSSERIRKVESLSRRSSRLKSGLTRIEGSQALREALRFAPDSLVDVYVSEAALAGNSELAALLTDSPVHGHLVSERVAKAVTEAAQGWIGVARLSAFPALSELSGSLALILPATQDPGNAGTLIRLADACGASAVFLGKDSADPTSPKVVRASVGSVFHLPTPRFSDFSELATVLHNENWIIAGTALEAPLNLGPETARQFAGKKIAWVMGNEAHGLAGEELALCDALVSIPMFGRAESLNVTQAATLALWLTASVQHSYV